MCQNLTLPTWFHGNISKGQAKILLNNRPFGTFLLRNSLNSDAVFTLSFRSNDNVLHVRIYQTKDDLQLYYLDAPKSKQQKFQSIYDLVQYCMNLEKGMKVVEIGEDNNGETFLLTEPLDCETSSNMVEANSVSVSCQRNVEWSQQISYNRPGPPAGISGLKFLNTVL